MILNICSITTHVSIGMLYIDACISLPPDLFSICFMINSLQISSTSLPILHVQISISNSLNKILALDNLLCQFSTLFTRDEGSSALLPLLSEAREGEQGRLRGFRGGRWDGAFDSRRGITPGISSSISAVLRRDDRVSILFKSRVSNDSGISVWRVDRVGILSADFVLNESRNDFTVKC